MQAILEDVEMVWDKAEHNAFPDLVRHRGGYIGVLREGNTHISYDGVIRVLRSDDGVSWSPISQIVEEGADLRDPRLSVTPDGELMVICAARQRDTGALFSRTWFSDKGKVWEGPHEVGEQGSWLWSVCWHQKSAYSFGYYGGKDDYHVSLYRSDDAGRHFKKWVDHAFCDGYCNEHSMVISEEDEAVMLLRCDPEPAVLGRAHAPFTDWRWSRLNKRIGGPQMVQWRGELLAGVRLYEPEQATWLCRINTDDSRLEPLLLLPSGGDNSYPGLCLDGDALRMLYYSEHSGRCAIWSALITLRL